MKVTVNANGIEITAETGGDQFALRILAEAGAYISRVTGDSYGGSVKSILIAPSSLEAAHHGQHNGAPAQGKRCNQEQGE